MKKVVISIINIIVLILVVGCTSEVSKSNESTLSFDYKTESKESDYSLSQQETSPECPQSEIANQSNFDNDIDILVYKTPTGKRYHLDPDNDYS